LNSGRKKGYNPFTLKTTIEPPRVSLDYGFFIKIGATK